MDVSTIETDSTGKGACCWSRGTRIAGCFVLSWKWNWYFLISLFIIENMTIMDDDIVEYSNLHRQIGHSEKSADDKVFKVVIR